ncbi:MAG TPA: ABC transporter permease [Gemmatimonadota bacterium]|nr:ABC transporter permease [Gemmatimonadota bacterium]
MLGLLPGLYFPPPTAITRKLVELFADGTLPRNLGMSLYRMVVGLLIGTGLGFLGGVVMGRSAALRRITDPIVGAVYPIPKIAILPLVMIFLGIGESSKLFVISIGAFFPMLISTLAGVLQIPSIYFEVAANYGTGRKRLLTRVILPASMPTVLGGLRIALNSVMHVTIAIEVVAAVTGLGALVWFSWETFDVEKLYATLVVIAVLGIGATHLVNRLSRGLVPWRP